MADVRPSGRYSARDRVRKRAEFLRIQQGGQRVVSPGFVFMLEQSAAGQGPRLGITASRRVGNSPQRNRAKRLVREAFRAVRDTWPRVDVVVIVRQGLGDRTLDDVVGEWQAARARILRRYAVLTEASDRAAAELVSAKLAAAELVTAEPPDVPDERRAVEASGHPGSTRGG